MHIEQTISLVVKGTPEQATRAARAHGFEDARVVNVLRTSEQVRMEAPGGRAREALACAWMCEPDERAPGYGFAAGSLLFYNEAR